MIWKCWRVLEVIMFPLWVVLLINHNVQPIALASSILEPPRESDNSGSESETPKKKTRLEKEVSLLASIIEKKEHDKEVARERRHSERQQLTKQSMEVYERMMNKLIDKF